MRIHFLALSIFLLVVSGQGCNRSSSSLGQSAASLGAAVEQTYDKSAGVYQVSYSFQPTADSSQIDFIELREIDSTVDEDFASNICASGIPVSSWNSPFEAEDSFSGAYVAGVSSQFRYALCLWLKDGSVLAAIDAGAAAASSAQERLSRAPRAASTKYTATKVTSGQFFTCALFSDGRIKCWGNNQYGQLGVGDTQNRGDAPNEMGENLPYVDLGTSGRAALKATSIAAGLNHVCAILSDNSVKCWGRNHAGQLGLGDTVDRGTSSGSMGNNLPKVDLGTGLTAKALAVGGNFSCAVLSDNSIKCWGDNPYGELGRGDTLRVGDSPKQMGNQLDSIDLGKKRTVKTASAGLNSVCATLDNNKVKCWGLNDVGQLGLGDAVNRGDSPGQMGNALDTVVFSSSSKATSISSGASHTCVRVSGSLKCWGDNYSGQLGMGLALEQYGDLSGQMTTNMPLVTLPASVSTIQAGFYTTCAQLSNNAIKCWGANHYGQLGIASNQSTWGTTESDMKNLPSVNIGSTNVIKMFSSQYGTTCLINKQSVIQCWGINTAGALGNGNTTNTGSSASQMGANLPIVDL